MTRTVLQPLYLPLVQYKPQLWLVKMSSNLPTRFFQKILCWTMQFHLELQTSVSKQRTLCLNVVKMQDLPFVKSSHSCWILFQGMQHPTACSAWRTSGNTHPTTQCLTLEYFKSSHLCENLRSQKNMPVDACCLVPQSTVMHLTVITQLFFVSYSNTVCGMYSSWYINHSQHQPYSNSFELTKLKYMSTVTILSLSTLIFPVYSPRPPKRPNPPRRMSVSAMNLTASIECPE